MGPKKASKRVSATKKPATARLSEVLTLGNTQVEITVGIGDQQKTYEVHESLICEASDYFKTALRGGFKGAETKQVSLLGVEPETFAFVLYWLYSGSLEKLSNTKAAVWCFIKVWLFCEEYQIPELQDEAMNQLRSVCKNESKSPPLDAARFVYDNTVYYEDTTKKPMLRSFLSDAVAWDMYSREHQSIDRASFAACTDLAIDVLASLTALSPGFPGCETCPWSNKKTYHVSEKTSGSVDGWV